VERTEGMVEIGREEECILNQSFLLLGGCMLVTARFGPLRSAVTAKNFATVQVQMEMEQIYCYKGI